MFNFHKITHFFVEKQITNEDLFQKSFFVHSIEIK